MEPRAGSHLLPTVMWQRKIYHIDDVARNTAVTFKRIHPNLGQIYDIQNTVSSTEHLIYREVCDGGKIYC